MGPEPRFRNRTPHLYVNIECIVHFSIITADGGVDGEKLQMTEKTIAQERDGRLGLQKVGHRIWTASFELKALGLDFGRNVTVLQLATGELVIHSTAPFGESIEGEIRELGPVRWITDPMLDHDTFSKQGVAAFPEATFLAPEGFVDLEGVAQRHLLPTPVEWQGEIEVLKIEGAPSFAEHVFFHNPSKTLIVCDLLVNFPDKMGLWESTLLRLGLGPHRAPGTSRRLKLAIKDKAAFRKSIEKVLKWDFESVVVGHGKPIVEDARVNAYRTFQKAGWI